MDEQKHDLQKSNKKKDVFEFPSRSSCETREQFAFKCAIFILSVSALPLGAFTGYQCWHGLVAHFFSADGSVVPIVPIVQMFISLPICVGGGIAIGLAFFHAFAKVPVPKSFNVISWKFSETLPGLFLFGLFVFFIFLPKLIAPQNNP